MDENLYSSELAQKFRYEHLNSGQNSVKMSYILINQLALKSGLKEYPKFWTWLKKKLKSGPFSSDH